MCPDCVATLPAVEPPTETPKACPTCGGARVIFDRDHFPKNCPDCHGSGRVPREAMEDER